ncbi:MAG: hypothetical protein IK079_00330, partial [Desulfovibrio sp.]|nr:hypothetical protein [Desulfovibrio sp.]
WFTLYTQTAKQDSSAVLPLLKKTPPSEENELPPPNPFTLRLTPFFADNSIEVSNLGQALLLGILAGLLLNFMPCVLPILSLKFSFLLTHSPGK